MNRLPRTFHQTFIPERLYLSEILRFGASSNSSTYREISDRSGIPTGKSTGKVKPTLDYCKAMGLIRYQSRTDMVENIELTDFGRIVFLEDLRLNERVTQLISHFNMCDQRNGADVWFMTFRRGHKMLTMDFTRDQLNSYLCHIYDREPNRNIVGPLINMYEDPTSFKKVGIVKKNGERITRLSAPILNEYVNAYTAWILSLLERYFPQETQVSVTELNKVCGWLAIAGWNETQMQKVLGLIEIKGGILIDRQMKPWVIQKSSYSIDWWPKFYHDLM